MELLFAWLAGLEVTRFAPADDQADALSASLSTVEAGGWTLSPYEGPALQPYLGFSRGPWRLDLAPALAFRQATATSAEGREAAVRTLEARAQLRAGHTWGPLELDLEAAWSGGRATVDGTEVGTSGSLWTVGPALGLGGDLGEHLRLVGRARLPVGLSADGFSVATGGSVALEWRR